MTPEVKTQPEASVERVPPVRQEVSLTGSDPAKTLETVRQLNLTESFKPLDERFGNLVLFQANALNDAGVLGGIASGDAGSLIKAAARPATEVSARVDRTRIRGTGAATDTAVFIRFDSESNPNYVRDHLGEWRSKDGGKTWTTEGPNFRVRRGKVEIDASGNYSFENTDYGVRSSFSLHGTSTRSLATASGETYSVTRNGRGVPVKFCDPTGDWTGDGRTWTNTNTGEVRRGSVSLSDFGEFKFTPEGGGEAQVRRTEQLERINKLQEEISTKYGVIFGRPGERRREDGSVLINGVPTEDELKTLQEVLDKTSHESYQGMKIWFIRPDENGETHYAHYVNESEKKGNHNCGAGCSHSKLIRSTNGDMVILPRSRQTVRGMDGLEGTLLHELAHHEQGERYGHSDTWGGQGSTAESRRMSEELGWVYSKRHGTNLLKDKDGGLWKFNEKNDTWRWVGGVKPNDGKHRLDNEGMRDRALVRPSSDYFDYPYEHHAEALAMYRLGVGESPNGPDRSTLAQQSPELYKRIRDFDQRSIDRTFGTENGESKFIRDLSGRLVANTPENRRKVQEQEVRWGIH